MPLIKCPECSAEVSDMALACVKCGVQLRKPQRSKFGKLVKYFFIFFNVLMGLWLYGGMSAASKTVAASSGAHQVGAAIGTGLGAIVVMVIWVFGAIILGLFVFFTRPK